MGDKPKALIENSAESLLETFAKVRLIDPYDVYQHLMSYWTDTMQDDVYMMVSEAGRLWPTAKPNTDLIPTPLIIDRYFAAEREAIEKLEAERDAITRQMEEMDEEHGGEDGLLAEAKTDKGKLTKVSVKARLKEIKHDKEAADERKVLEDYLALIEKESAASKKVKDAQKALDAKVAAQYAKLSEDEIKTLVVDDKWLATLPPTCRPNWTACRRRSPGASSNWPNATPRRCPGSPRKWQTLSARVDEHLKKMGAVWN